MAIEKKYFPIKTDTACQLKWNWSTLYLNSGITASCHRTSISEITAENFLNFHNTPLKLADRQRMLDGVWPEQSCRYCRDIEIAGGTSDRMRHLTIPDQSPPELDINPQAINISPTLVEVFFNNTCNLGCLYCNPELSSTIETENKKFGDFKISGVELINSKNHYKDLSPHFWNWFPEGFIKLKRLHFMGGEPFYQKELDILLEMIEKHPNPDCEINLVTNLMVSKKRIIAVLEKFKQLLVTRKIKRLDISCSIDCWGPQQEYVRWGLNLNVWEENFKILMENKWLYMNINQTIGSLTIKTMSDLLIKLREWRKDRKIGHWFSGVSPGPSYLKGEIFSDKEFKNDAVEILNLMPKDTDEEKTAVKYMEGIFKQILGAEQNIDEIKKLLTFLNEKDRRRNTNWRELFPWLIKYEDLCGIQE